MIDVLHQVSEEIQGPFALGDQISLADLHVIAFLARLMAVSCQLEGEKDGVIALDKALGHECLKGHAHAQGGLSPKVRYDHADA
jgi:glutathione S-transferase